MNALLAAAPALPLDEAGKYVAGAILVFVGTIVIYVAIMAWKLQRMSREMAELRTVLDARERTAAPAGEDATDMEPTPR
jgi:hypothetical protein